MGGNKTRLWTHSTVSQQCHSTVSQNCVNAGRSVSQSLLKQRRYLLVQLTGTITVELSGVRTVTVSGSMVDTLALRRIIESSALDIQFDFQWSRYCFNPSDEVEINIYHYIRRAGHVARFSVKQVFLPMKRKCLSDTLFSFRFVINHGAS